MVPWMLSGESFDATHLAIPAKKYDSKMLQSWLDWTDMGREKDVVTDFRIIAKVRMENTDIFHNNIHETKLINVPCSSTPESPVKPYVRYISGKKACIVIGSQYVSDCYI